MANIQKIAPMLWFDRQAEDAARYYTGIFKGSKITKITKYGEEGFEVTRMPAGTVMTVEFELEGQRFTALNGGPHFRFNEAISFVVTVDSQEELDQLWNRLTSGGDEKAQQCGWLKDKFGVSWQVVPRMLAELFTDPDSPGGRRAMRAMLKMKKLDIAELKKAHSG